MIRNPVERPQRCDKGCVQWIPCGGSCKLIEEAGIHHTNHQERFMAIVGCASYSHSSAGEPDETTVCWHCPFQKGCDYGEDYCEWPCKRWFNWHDQQVAQAEREKVLNPVWQFFMDHDCEVRESHGQKWYWVSGDFPLSELMQLVESLRGEGK